jgi:cytochrome c oxidase cbb3-type subunit 3/ubiquinol-cytochrome c reductase cytochrome c subunit
MKQRSVLCLLLAASLAALATGCNNAPGKPREGVEEQPRPEHVLDFATLYKQNCSACHGANGQLAASVSLNNPVYLAIAGEANIAHNIAAGVPGTLMPAFSKSAGGMLTDQQIAVLAHGMVAAWGKPLPAGVTAPPYAATTPGDAAAGEKSFATYCASCHGAYGTGKGHTGSIVDPAYLALVKDQYLRSNVVAGRPESGMPDWSQHTVSGAKHAMTDAEITDIVAWIAGHRTATPGQPYPKNQ